ncbi:MAG TPA: chromosome segregation protein SMC [Rhodanobacteraceae bacterium]|nr:chromosome segregation protein SMC [Rhodanobacteraceae bacterium]
MRLTTIKLAGFKSFVDPTTLHLPTNMSGIVGPNGCGKSNIIDAIRWVMGESAASRLRGDALTDVIFSGSSGRKPVGSAMVELLFDNSDGLIVGEYASYNEISVKRIVSRDGQSQYFLNGVRCRRRDITDIFLGTGLGPRSYSIIEQGMISEIVEADPEQLRNHLEEAAGISKYKERRKETESRIKATRENLDRVRDVRDEVEKQLEHLKRQARAAERWQGYKNEQKKKEAELKALSLREAKAAVGEHSAELRKAELAIEQQVAEQRHTEAELETGREKHATGAESLNKVQSEVYRIGADIARVEQQIQHHKELTEQLQRAREETERAHGELATHIANDRGRHEEVSRLLAEAEPKMAELRAADEGAAEAARVAEAKLGEWQSQWDSHAGVSSQATQSAEVERTKIDYLDRQLLQGDQRRGVLEAERSAANLDDLSKALEALNAQHVAAQADVETSTRALDERRASAETLLERERAVHATLSAKRGELEAARGRLGSLEALQHAALGETGAAVSEWLQRAGLGNPRRLGETLQVDGGWERAVETVLDGWLEAALVDDPRQAASGLASLEGVDLTLMDGSDAGGGGAAGTLAAVTNGPAAARRMLSRVRTARSLDEAREVAARIGEGESVVTPAGEWLGAGFARVSRGAGSQVGVIAREREIRELKQSARTLEGEIAGHVEAVDIGKRQRIEAEQDRDEAQRAVYTAHRRLAEISGQIQSQKGRIDGARERLERVGAELEELERKLAADRTQASEARGRLEAAVSQMGEHELRRQSLDSERRSLLEAREEARMNAREARENAHQMALSVESRRAALASLDESLQRMQGQLAQFDARRTEIASQLASGSSPVEGLESERQAYLNQRLTVDRQLVEARQALQEQDAELRRLEQERHRIEQGLNERRDAIAEMRLREQEHRLRAQALESAITEAGFTLDEILGALPAEAEAAAWQGELADLEQKIKRLEPVNLAAIQEFDEQSQRKTYLDAQLTDLTTALETLEGAIRKIDKETRARFKETFDRVNTGIQELFPRLFGGGHAYLEMTGEDLLSTGVTIMARPPGKRVSSISLLSGGEKALTAVALVFSIFRLNPAPFCLLDEVDAPLDEANIGRFSSLVTEMSEHVQFIFVTHNKGTMEAAHQLCGVTMREPGVSRLVQVDLAEAAKLAGAA